jgi:hypothetical protein
MTPDLSIDLTGKTAEDWFASLEDLTEESGYIEQVSDKHAALFIDAGRKLLVTFEQRSTIMERPRAVPRGFELVSKNGWSLLSIIAEDDTWFRDPRLFGFFDRQVDDGFFEDFDDVVFYGVREGGYAAGAYSVAAPGARVVMLRPVATLSPSIAGWDRRFLAQRKLDFTSRYGYAPDMIEAAEEAFVIFDPTAPHDAIHAALFRSCNLVPLPARHARPQVERLFDEVEITVPLLEQAMAGTLTAASFARLFRARRKSPTYLRNLLRHTERNRRAGLSARICRFGLTQPDAAFYQDYIRRRRLAAAEQTAAQ